MRALVAAALVLSSACSPLTSSSPHPTSGATSSPSDAPIPTLASTLTPIASDSPWSPTASAPTPAATATAEFEFIRWIGGYTILASEPGGPVSASQDVHVDQIAAVLDRVQIDTVEWLRVQYGSDRSGDFVQYGWAPAVADIDRDGGTHVDPVYEYINPECPAGQPSLAELGGLVPLQAVYCFGSTTLTFSPVQVRDEGSEESGIVEGTPEWLAEGGELVAYWLPEREDAGSIRLHVDPASDIAVPVQKWIEISGHLDDPLAARCERSSEYGGFVLENRGEAVQLCRGRFVVSGTRVLTEAEIPRQPLAPGPEPALRVGVSVRESRAPVSNLHSSSTVWTGDQLLVWGGWDAGGDPAGMTNDGFAYTPASTDWASIPAAPLVPRARSQIAWTGSELLVWGGEKDEDSQLSDGAAYDPVTGAWRVLSKSPLASGHYTASNWNGAEWWIAAENVTGGVDVAAYEPAADKWRTLPSVLDDYADPPTIAWTGSETLLMTAAGLFSMSKDAADWTQELPPGEFHAPALWAGDRLVMMADSPIGDNALDFAYLTHPVAWEPQTRAIVELPLPPRNVFEPVFAGSHLAFFEQGLAFDFAAGDWVRLDVTEAGRKALELVQNTAVWAGDRLVVWGGVDACTGEPSNRDRVLELVPQWALAHSFASSPSTQRFAVSTPSGTTGGTANSGGALFAC
jgi:hypothetical protein